MGETPLGIWITDQSLWALNKNIMKYSCSFNLSFKGFDSFDRKIYIVSCAI